MLSFVVLAWLIVTARPVPCAPAESALDTALRNAEEFLTKKDAGASQPWVDRALERDAKSTRAWDLRARWAEKAADKDELVYALHQELRLSIAQKQPRSAIEALQARLLAVDPLATELLGLSDRFIAKLAPIAEQYEKDSRPHSAIRVHKEILALDPESPASLAAIERISAAPDPSLAGDAQAEGPARGRLGGVDPRARREARDVGGPRQARARALHHRDRRGLRGARARGRGDGADERVLPPSSSATAPRTTRSPSAASSS